MQYVWLPFFFVLAIFTAFIGYALLVTWRRLRQLEARVDASDEQGAQAELLLHEYIAEFETAAESILSSINEKEQTLRQFMSESTHSLVDREPASQPQLQRVNRVALAPGPEPVNQKQRDPKQAVEIIRLHMQGLDAIEIARRQKVGRGEVELILQLARLKAGQDMEEESNA